jgi:hypothetical protein
LLFFRIAKSNDLRRECLNTIVHKPIRVPKKVGARAIGWLASCLEKPSFFVVAFNNILSACPGLVHVDRET